MAVRIQATNKRYYYHRAAQTGPIKQHSGRPTALSRNSNNTLYTNINSWQQKCIPTSNITTATACHIQSQNMIMSASQWANSWH